MAGVTDGIDGFQRRSPALGVPIAVFYKYVDDQGSYLAAIITYYAFVAIFPLLLIGSTTLGVVLQGNPDLEQQVLDSALAQFPVVGTELGIPGGLTGSPTAVVLGSLAALYGALGLGQAIQNATNIAWSVPRNSRPNPLLLRVKSLALLVMGGVALLAVIVLSIIVSHTEVLGVNLASYEWPVALARSWSTPRCSRSSSDWRRLEATASGARCRVRRSSRWPGWGCNGSGRSTCSGCSTAPAR